MKRLVARMLDAVGVTDGYVLTATSNRASWAAPTGAGGGSTGLAPTINPKRVVLGAGGSGDAAVTGSPAFTWQGGTFVAGGAATITFDAPFPNGVVTVVATNGDTGANNGQVGVRNVTKTGFTITPGGAGGFRANWFAIGW